MDNDCQPIIDELNSAADGMAKCMGVLSKRLSSKAKRDKDPELYEAFDKLGLATLQIIHLRNYFLVDIPPATDIDNGDRIAS